MGASESVDSSVGISVAGPLSLEGPSGYFKTEKCAGGTSELFDVPESENTPTTPVNRNNVSGIARVFRFIYLSLHNK